MSRTSLPPVRHQTRGAEPSPRINEDDEDLAGKIMGSQVPAERVLSSVLREEFAHPEQQRNWLAMTVAATNPDHPAHDFFIQRRERMRTHLSSG